MDPNERLPTNDAQDDIMQNLNSQFTMRIVSLLTTAIESKCIRTCIKKPGASLSRGDEACLAKCMDTYLESWSTVSDVVNQTHSQLLEHARNLRNERNQ